jgi:hypothetical protein
MNDNNLLNNKQNQIEIKHKYFVFHKSPKKAKNFSKCGSNTVLTNSNHQIRFSLFL